METIFISHSWEDREAMSRIKECMFKQFYCSCFLAHEDIAPSTEWKKELLSQLDNALFLLAFLNSRFKASEFTSHEVGYALGRSTPIICIIDKRDSASISPFGLMPELQALKFNPDKGQFYDICRSILKYAFKICPKPLLIHISVGIEKQYKRNRLEWNPKTDRKIDKRGHQFEKIDQLFDLLREANVKIALVKTCLGGVPGLDHWLSKYN